MTNQEKDFTKNPETINYIADFDKGAIQGTFKDWATAFEGVESLKFLQAKKITVTAWFDIEIKEETK